MLVSRPWEFADKLSTLMHALEHEGFSHEEAIEIVKFSVIGLANS